MTHMTDTQKVKCHAIIHTASASAAAVGAGLAQIPGSDNAVIMPIQLVMTISLGRVFGLELTESAAGAAVRQLDQHGVCGMAHVGDGNVRAPELARRGIRMAVASNKFQEGTAKLIARFFPGVEFAAVFGQRPDVPLKPDPAVVAEILGRTGVGREQVLYVGDSGVDMQTARAAGVRSVGVTWGFRDRAFLEAHGATCFVENPSDILKRLKDL